MLNVQLLDRIATWLEAGAPHTSELHNMSFDMKELVVVPTDQFANEKLVENWCGTRCCIAGAAVVFAAPEQLTYDKTLKLWDTGNCKFYIWDEAKNLLGLTDQQASLLFAPHQNGSYTPAAHDITPEWAARTIRNLIVTGDEVKWN